MKHFVTACLLTACFAFLSPVYAYDNDDDFSLAEAYGDEEFIYIATGRKQTVSEAPAVASIISAKSIRQMGARDIDEVLESIPGLHVSYSAGGYNPIYQIRGITSDVNPQVLMLINGIPITNVFAGDRSQAWGGMPVENISRIEVIRGPGSAIYGADAYAGTINIITKNATEIDGLELGASAGSFNEYRAWLQYGGEFAGWQTAFSAQLADTNGQKEKINADAQTFYDGLFINPRVSLAPGSVNTGKQSLDVRGDIEKGRWHIRAGYQSRKDVETAAGLFSALDNKGTADADRYNADITYQNTDFSENWDIKAQYSFFNSITRSNLTLLPAGTLGGAFPDGVIGEPDVYERHNRIDLSAFYTGLTNHDVRVGAGFHHQDQYKIEEKRNFYIAPGPMILPLGSLVDVSDTTPFNQEKTRKIYYAFVQDAWDFAPDWTLTAGLRYDHYSDFGSTLNPRLALVWQTSYRLTSKLLYGRSFRAPSFAEQFNINNPVALGNPNLDPEVIDTYELAFDYAASDDLKLSLNLFHYTMEDIIRFNPTTANNTGSQSGHGLEMEVNWQASNRLNVYANYAYQSSEDKETDSNAADAPEQQAYLRANYAIDHTWSINTQLNHVRDRNRAFGDTRGDIDNYTVVDLTLRAKEFAPGFEFALSAKNLFDETVREPSLAPGLIPDDLPQAGRGLFVELRKTIN